MSVLTTAALLSLVTSTVPGSPAGRPANPSSQATLTIKVECLRDTQGFVMVALYDSADAHLSQEALANKLEPGTRTRGETVESSEDGTTVWTIEDLQPGRYSVAIYQDRNSNSELDRGRIGLPKEPYGFSNNKRARFGPPKWKDSVIEVKGQVETTVCVK